MQHEIPASFTWSLQDYTAFVRGVGMFQNKSYDSWLMRVGILFFGHLFLVTGLLITALAISGVGGRNGPIPMPAVAMNLVFSLVASYFLFTKWYRWRWMVARAFRSSQLPNLKVTYLFLPAQIESTSRLIQSKRDWSAVSEVAEFRDAFILLSGNAVEWLPKHAFVEPFDDL